MHIKLADVLKLECEKPCVDIIHATVIDKSSVTTYNINKQMATVIFADGTVYVKALVYDLDALTMMAVNKGIQIQDFIPKPNRYLCLYIGIQTPKHSSHVIYSITTILI